MTSFGVPAVAALTAGGSILSGYETSRELNREASDTMNLATANAAAKRREVEQSLGQTTAAYGASGVDLSSGSALDALAQSAGQGELDAQNILYEGKVRASNLRTQAKSAKASGYLNAATSLFKGYDTLSRARGNFKSIGG